MEQRVVTIIGGTGFVGRYVVKALAAAGYTLRVISRSPNNALHLKTSGNVGQIVLVHGDLNDPSTLKGHIEGSYAVVNLAGVLFDSSKNSFSHVHSKGAHALAKLAKAAGVQRFVHVSALGVDQAKSSAYARSKLHGEKSVLESFSTATILRPSIIFGPEDNFFNQFACMAGIVPMLPLVGGGRTHFQPVYVSDVAKAVEHCLSRNDVLGQTYELGGPDVYTFREIMEYILHTIDKSRLLMPLPSAVASVMGFGFEFFPRPPITRDQVRLLKYDNVVSANAKTLSDLGISPTAIDVIVPEYLARFHRKAA